MTRVRVLLRRLRSEEAGTTIIEVLASAIVLALVSVGVLAGLDGAQNQSNQNRLRSVAASLAQADQERLRGLRTSQLYNRNETRTVPVRGAQFSVNSTAAWLLDSGTTDFPCSGKGNYMRIKSSVSWPGMGTKPVSVTSLVTPPGQAGTVSATITSSALVGLPGIAVTMTGPQTKTETTDARGCVFFGQLQPGAYALTFSKPGHIDPDGVNAVSRDITTNAESTVNETFRYDQPGSITANFNTKRGSAAQVPSHPGWGIPGAAFASLSHSGLLQGTKSYTVAAPSPITNPYATSATMNNLFPFSDGYSVYAGGCPGANPASYTTAPTTSPFAVPNNQIVLPGGSHSVPVRLPAVRFRYRTQENSQSNERWVAVPAKNTTSANATGLTVAKLTATSPGCGGVTSWNLDDCSGTPQPVSPACTPSDVNSDTGGYLDRPQGRPLGEDWGAPIGSYDFCVDIANSYNPQGTQGSGNYKGTATNVMVKNPAGETVDLNDLTTGDCP